MSAVLEKRRADDLPAASTIVPIIRSSAIVRQIAALSVAPSRAPVVEPLLADLVVTYAFDLPGLFRMVNELDCSQLGLSLDSLRDTALTNMRDKAEGVLPVWDAPLMRLALGGQLEPSMLLLREFWNCLATNVPGEVVVALPAPNALLVSSTEAVGGGASRLRSELGLAIQPSKALSQHLLVWRDGLWEVLIDNAAERASTEELRLVSA